jgi:hypothetical protein
MANLKFDKEITALLVTDPYNDFISEGGKIWIGSRLLQKAHRTSMLASREAHRRRQQR